MNITTTVHLVRRLLLEAEVRGNRVVKTSQVMQKVPELLEAIDVLQCESAVLWDALRELKGHDYCGEVIRQEHLRIAALKGGNRDDTEDQR